MDFIDQLRQFASRVEKMRTQITTEEATKTSMIMPFFQMLGYDVFNPLEFVPEFTADVGIKKGEKVDYAIIRDGQPVILIEAKWCGESLQKHDSQLFRYFGTTSAKFAILTNGIIYKFYTDLESQNVMDEKPFFEFNLLDLKDTAVNELKRIQKHNFDVDNLFSAASELKYSNQIKQLLGQQMNQPSDAFVNYVLGEIYSGRKTQAIVEKFREIVKRSFTQFVSELMNDRIKAALDSDAKAEAAQTEIAKETTDVPPSLIAETEKSKIITLAEELEGFYAVKSILRDIISLDRVVYRDTESYFGILIDDNKLKWVCRLQVDGQKKCLIVPDIDKKPIKLQISGIDDIYKYKDQLIDAAKRYL